jgi:hypothetical protein
MRIYQGNLECAHGQYTPNSSINLIDLNNRNNEYIWISENDQAAV